MRDLLCYSWTLVFTCHLLSTLVHVSCSLAQLVRRVSDGRAQDLANGLCAKVASTAKKDSGSRDIAK